MIHVQAGRQVGDGPRPAREAEAQIAVAHHRIQFGQLLFGLAERRDNGRHGLGKPAPGVAGRPSPPERFAVDGFVRKRHGLK